MFDSFHQSHAFRREIEQWVQEDIISPAQAEILKTKYQLDQPAPWYRDASFILKATGLLLGIVGILLFIAANWTILPTPLRMLIGLVPWVACYVGVWRGVQAEDRQKTELWFFAASLLLGVNIALQGQIFHISSYFPDGVLWWILGSLPAMLYFRSTIFLITLQVLYIIWIVLQNEYHQFSWFSPLIVFGFLYVLHRQTTAIGTLFFAPVLWLFFFNITLRLTYRDSYLANTFIYFSLLFSTIVAFYFYSVLYFQERFSQGFLLRFKQVIYLIATGLFFLLTFASITDEVLRLTPLLTPSYGILYAILVGAIALATSRFEKRVSFIVTLLMLGIVHLMVWSGGSSNKDFANFWAIVNAALLLAYSIGLIWEGIRLQYKTNFMAGLLYLMVLALKVYIALIQSYETTALIFIICGGGLYYANQLWNKKLMN